MAHPLESVRVIWSPTDEQFFHSTAGLFGPEFLWGAGTLLASYDEDDAHPPATTEAPSVATVHQSAARRRAAA